MDTWQRATRYIVSAVPEHLCPDWYAWNVNVEWRGDDRWAVCYFDQCADTDGVWDWEALPSSRTEDWKNTHYFSEKEALRLAHQVAPTIEVNGMTAAALITKYRNGS